MYSPDNPRLIQEQIAYYRARASEYDEWYLRAGRYDHGPEWNAIFHAELEEAYQALCRFGPTGQVLELASGTGWWTGTLARLAEGVTAVDASAETLEYNRRRNGTAKIRYVQADLFAWQADRQYDAVFFGCWLSHVPPSRFEEFWALVKSALRPGGQVFFVDTLQRDIQTLGAANHHQQGQEEPGVTVRYLNDGRSYRIIKVFYQPAELAGRLRELGWAMQLYSTRHYFLFGSGGYEG